MSITITKCRQCGATTDGTFCSFHCEIDYEQEQDRKEQHRLRERSARELFKTRQAARSAYFKTLGPR